MSVLSQGTKVWFRDPDATSGGEIVEIKGLNQFAPGGTPAEQIDDTDLAETERKFKRGMRTPGQATGTVKADPAIPAHIRLAELANDDTDRNIEFFIGWSDGTAAPTFASGAVVLPLDRTFYNFQGYISDFPFDFTSNSIVTTQLSIQRSGKGQWLRKGRSA
jgi:hypothetical protein